jgi:hypothetical protein
MLHYIVLHMFAMLYLKCFRALGIGGIVGKPGALGGAQDRGVVEVIYFPFYSDMQGRDSILFQYAGASSFMKGSGVRTHLASRTSGC